MGLLSAAAVPSAVGMLGAAYEKPSKRKNYAFAYFSAGNPLGFVFGTLFSGIATHLFNWRASFWLLAIIYLVITVLAFFIVPNDDSSMERPSAQTLKKFDIGGTLLTVTGIGMFSSSLRYAMHCQVRWILLMHASIASDAPQGWRTPYVLVLLILGVLALVGFVFGENYCKFPLVPMGIWKDRDFSLVSHSISMR